MPHTRTQPGASQEFRLGPAPWVPCGVRRYLVGALLLVACRPATRTDPRTGPGPAPPADGAPRDGCQEIQGDSGQAGAVPVRADIVVDGLEVPWSIGFLPGGDWLITERPGRLRLVRGGRLIAQPVARVEVASPAEGGLLGLALSPDFARDQRFFLYYSVLKNGEPVNRIARWKLADDHLSAAEEVVLLDDIPGALYHDGGRLRFGPDRLLYVGTGDGRRPERSQDVRSPNGKILRLTADGQPAPNNPWGALPAFVAGLRNVEAFDFGPDGALYIADHGPSGEYLGRTGHDEIDVAHPGDNLGWPTVYGCEQRPPFVAPVLTWTDAVPPGGAAIYTGDRIPEWRGSFVVGTLKSRQLVRVDLGAHPPTYEVYFRGDPPAGYGRLRDVVMGPNRELYVTTSNCDGRGTCPPDKDKVLRITRR